MHWVFLWIDECRGWIIIRKKKQITIEREFVIPVLETYGQPLCLKLIFTQKIEKKWSFFKKSNFFNWICEKL